MGRKPLNYPCKQKHFLFPDYICKKLEKLPNQTKFMIECVERGLEINNTTLERLQKKERQLELELTEIRNEIGKIQKEKLTKAELKVKEQERFLKNKYNQLCATITCTTSPYNYANNKEPYYQGLHKRIHEEYFIDLDKETIEKIKQENFSFVEYKNRIPKNLKIVQEES